MVYKHIQTSIQKTWDMPNLKYVVVHQVDLIISKSWVFFLGAMLSRYGTINILAIYHLSERKNGNLEHFSKGSS